MRNISRIYQTVLKKYPVGTQAVQAGILMGLGDQIAQNFIESSSKPIDYVRTMQFAGIGLFISGPATRTWYGILDTYIGSKGYTVGIKKVACDQLLFAPTFIAVLLVAIGVCQGKDIEKLKIKLANEYSDILINNYKCIIVILAMAYGTTCEFFLSAFELPSSSCTISCSAVE
ncbi:protein Mpv17 isoform X2 [Odontomachus brunneus]|uniref:protein Mpv17 isoform X2 n=1 Tax=Odontomachus brunneus TaxID=486640 RepID=UPI0013F1F85F|nr:protein Mpv17 isoform X2 [Odontomachus brunneus]